MKNTPLFIGLFLFLILSGCDSDDDNGRTILPQELNFSGRVISCGDFLVVQLLDAENPHIVLNIDGNGREDLELTSEYKSFSLPDNDLALSITVWDASPEDLFCNDVIMDGPKLLSTWNAVSGNVSLRVSDVEETEFETLYRISIRLEDVVFENSVTAEQRSIESLHIENAAAGWLPG